MYVSISLLRNVEGGDPSPHASKKQKKCGSCHSFLTDLDPHSECNTRGNQLRGGGGGNKSGKVCPEVPSSPKADSPGRLRLAALESGFSSFKTEISSMFASLTGRLTASHPPDPKAGGSRLQDGGAHGGEIFPSRELEDPLASQRPFTGLLGPSTLPLVGRAPGCDLSGPSCVMEP